MAHLFAEQLETEGGSASVSARFERQLATWDVGGLATKTAARANDADPGRPSSCDESLRFRGLLGRWPSRSPARRSGCCRVSRSRVRPRLSLSGLHQSQWFVPPRVVPDVETASAFDAGLEKQQATLERATQLAMAEEVLSASPKPNLSQKILVVDTQRTMPAEGAGNAFEVHQGRAEELRVPQAARHGLREIEQFRSGGERIQRVPSARSTGPPRHLAGSGDHRPVRKEALSLPTSPAAPESRTGRA